MRILNKTKNKKKMKSTNQKIQYQQKHKERNQHIKYLNCFFPLGHFDLYQFRKFLIKNSRQMFIFVGNSLPFSLLCLLPSVELVSFLHHILLEGLFLHLVQSYLKPLHVQTDCEKITTAKKSKRQF